MPSSVSINAGTRRLKIAVMGSEGVGKTSIIRSIVSDPIAKLASICNTDMGLSYHVHIDNISMDITEVSFRPVDNIAPLLDLNPAIQTSDAFVLVYAVDDLASFDYLETVKDTIVKSRSSDVPVIVVGNKTDLIRCAIDYEVVDCIVSIDWEMYYTETSAKTDDSVTSILPSLFHHRKLRHHHFPSQIKEEYGSLQRTVSRRKTVTFTMNDADEDNKRERAQSESWNQKSNKEKRESGTGQTDKDFFKFMKNINENRRDSVESMNFKSLLTGSTQNTTTDKWRTSSVANLLKTAKPRTPSFTFFSDLLSSGTSTNHSSSSSSPSDNSPSEKSSPRVNESFVFKFIFEMKNGSSASSPINTDPEDDFDVSLDPEAMPMRQRCYTSGARINPRTEDARLRANRRMSYAGSTKRNAVHNENRNDWVASVFRFLKK